MRRTNLIVFLSIDSFLSPRGKPLLALEEFLAALEQRDTPCIWLTGRSRSLLDEPRRKLGHQAPFVAEFGGGAYLPEGYFHLKPETKTLRLGRFTCIPVAELQQSARTALDDLVEETGVSVVTLRSLSPRELAQNIRLPQHEAELARMRDFSELFFFAGASDDAISGFLAYAAKKSIAISRFNEGPVYSAAVGASEDVAMRAVSKLYDRALHARVRRLMIAQKNEPAAKSAVCDRILVLEPGTPQAAPEPPKGSKIRQISMGDPGLWPLIIAAIDTAAGR